MKQILFLFTFSILLLACNNNDTNKASIDTTIQHVDTATNRKVVIEELKRLQAIFASNDKEKIAGLFHFPISNETVGIYIDDSAFNAQLAENQNKISKPLFLRFYQHISESLQIAELNQLFKSLQVDSLLHKGTLAYDAIIKTKPCYHYYNITIEKDIVTLTVGTSLNKEYKPKNLSEDEIAENRSSICEHMLWWVFQFDGKQLVFKEVSGAG